MPYKLLLLIILLPSLISYNAYAEGSIKECFETQTTDGGIEFCLKLLNKDIFNTRSKLEQKIIYIIQNDNYLQIPIYKPIETKNFEEAPSQISIGLSGSKSTSNRAKADFAIKRAIRRAKEKQIAQKEKENLITKRRYQIKKDSLIEKLHESNKLFTQYMEMTCNIRKSHFIDDANTFSASLEYETCLHEMTKQQIKSLTKLTDYSK